jgi:hypothetical protein
MPEIAHDTYQIHNRNTKCINCGKPGTQKHHVVPKELGGNDTTNCVWLCDKCHGLIHNITYGKKQISHSELTKIGLEKARLQGIQLGRPPGQSHPTRKEINMKKLMLELLKDFNGSISDTEFIRRYPLSRKTFININSN